MVVTARLPYVTHGDGMHTFTDPADGETYVSAYCGMDIAHRVLACFDQNDLKASLTLTVTADPAWTVLGNGRATSLGAGRWTFSPMPTIPVALFVVCAGPWHSVTWEHDGLPCGWHARRSLAAELDRDAPELRTTTDGVLDHYAGIFTEPYPFDSCDQIFVPGLNWGAQENPGCVTYRDEMLPRERITDDLRTFRATVIAHEQAHMWFGNLVTMRWFEDTWLQESFADYFGYRVAEDGAGFADALGAPRDRPQAGGVRRRRAPVHPPGRAAGRGRARRRRGADQLRLDLLRQGQLRAAPAGHLAGRRGVPGRRQRPPDPAPLRQRDPRRLRRVAGRRVRPRRARVGAASGCAPAASTPSG